MSKLDLNKPLWGQVSIMTNEEYENICNKPIIYGDAAYTFDYSTIKLYESSFYNYMTNSSLMLCYSVWFPYTLLFYNKLISFNPICLIFGFISWFCYAYWMHRFHHIDISNKYANSYYRRLWHFNGHGYHHICPHDNRRIIIHPFISSIIIIPHGIITYMFQNDIMLNFQIGLILGHMFVETSHYSVHYFTILTPFIKQLKNHHLSHHYKLPTKLFAYGHKLEDKIWTNIVGDVKNT